MKKLLALVLVMLLALPMMAEEPWSCANYILTPEPELLQPVALRLPNTTPFFGNSLEAPTLIVEKLPLAVLVRWQGLTCDQIWLPVGSEIRAINYGEWLENWLFTIGPDGWLDYRWSPK